jgi:hypothetical protein
MSVLESQEDKERVSRIIGIHGYDQYSRLIEGRLHCTRTANDEYLRDITEHISPSCMMRRGRRCWVTPGVLASLSFRLMRCIMSYCELLR